MKSPTSIDFYKQQASRLQEYLLAGGTDLKRTHALEAIAQIHGFSDFHALCFAGVSISRFDGVLDVTRWVRKHQTQFHDLYGEVVLALNTPNGLYAAVKYDDVVRAEFCSPRAIGYYRVYPEGSPYACDCPPRILNMLSPTSSEDVLVWREACWINALRADIYRDPNFEGPAPWTLLSAMRPIEGFKPRLAARVCAVGASYVASDGKVLKEVQAEGEWLEGTNELDVGSEDPLNESMHMLRPGLPWKWLRFGSAPFRVWALVTRDGGLISWTANPFHYGAAAHQALGDDPFSLPDDAEAASEGKEPDDEETGGGLFGRDGSQALLEHAARGPLHAGAGTYEQLKARVLAGRFDPT